MNLLGMGPGELLLIAMLGLIVFGPGKLPEIAGQVGRAVRDLRRSTSEMTQEFQEAMRPLNEVAEFPNEIKGAVGAAAVIAQQGVAGQEQAQAGAPAEPPTTDTPEWHWEGAESAAGAQPAAASTASSFWDWDAPEPAPAAPIADPAEASQTAAATTNGSVWQWDEAAPTPTEPTLDAAPSADAAPVASLNGTAAPPKADGQAHPGHAGAEPEPDVALVGESPTASHANTPPQRKPTDPTEGPA